MKNHLEWIKSHRRLLAIFFLALLTFSVYANSLPNKFVWDDEEQIVNNKVIQDFSGLGQIFTSSTFYAGGAGLSGGFYRPMMSLWFFLNYHLWGLTPWAFRLLQILFHVVNASLLFFIFSRILASQNIRHSTVLAYLAALIFAVHPANVESVAYIASAGDVLYAFFLLTAFYLLLIRLDARLSIELKHVILIFGLILAALFAKENAIAIFPILLVYIFLFLRPKKDIYWKYIGVSLGLSGFYLLLRWAVAGITFNLVRLSPIAKAGFFERILTIPYEVVLHIKNVLFPLKLAIYQHFVVRSVSDARFWGSLIFLLALLYFLFSFSKKLPGPEKKLYVFGLSWFGIGLIPVLNLIPLDMTIAERWLYFPMIGFLFALFVLSNGMISRSQGKLRFFIYLIFIAVIIVFSARSIARNLDWRDGLTLYGHDIRYTDRDNANLENNFGVELFRTGKKEEAEKHFLRSVEIEERWSVSRNNLGAAFENRGEIEKAESEYRKATEISDYYLAYQNLAGILMKRKKFDEAQIFVENALLKFPQNPDLYFRLAVINYIKENKDEAQNILEQSLRLNPQDPRTLQMYMMMKNGEDIKFEE